MWCSSSLRKDRRETSLVEDTYELCHLAFERYRQPKQCHEVRQLDASFHGTDVRVRQAGTLRERFLRETTSVPELSESRPEQFCDRCGRSAHRRCSLLTKAFIGLILLYQFRRRESWTKPPAPASVTSSSLPVPTSPHDGGGSGKELKREIEYGAMVAVWTALGSG